jgi:hypothetical protein
MKIIDAKIAPEYFDEVEKGNKTFEYRDNADKDYQIGDIVRLHEFISGENKYTGSLLWIKITYLLKYYGRLHEDDVIFSFQKMPLLDLLVVQEGQELFVRMDSPEEDVQFKGKVGYVEERGTGKLVTSIKITEMPFQVEPYEVGDSLYYFPDSEDCNWRFFHENKVYRKLAIEKQFSIK